MSSSLNKKNLHLAFEVGNKSYSAPILSLDSIVEFPQVYLIKNSPEFVSGIAQIKDNFIPLLDLRQILNSAEIATNTLLVIVVRVTFKDEKKLVGFVVDSVRRIYDFENTEMTKLPALSEEFIDGVFETDSHYIFSLNFSKIINSEDIIYFLNQIWNIKAKSSSTK